MVKLQLLLQKIAEDNTSASRHAAVKEAVLKPC